MAIIDYDKKVRISKKRLDELKKLAKIQNVSAAKLLDDILDREFYGHQQELRLKNRG